MKTSLKTKILASTLIPALVIAVVFTVVFTIDIMKTGTDLVENYRKSLFREKQAGLINSMQIALNAIKGKSPEDAMAILAMLRYDKDDKGYFWINDTGTPYPVMLMHPTVPELDGKVLDSPDFNKALDEKGRRKNLFVASVETCLKDGKGFVKYAWPKPMKNKLTEERPKLSYVYLLEPYDWIIGTGVYIDDIDELVALEKAKIRQSMKRILIGIGLVGLTLMAIFVGLIIFLIDKYVIRQIRLIRNTLKNFNNDLSTRVEVVAFDEIGDLADWLNHHIADLQATIGKVMEAVTDVNRLDDEIAQNVEKYASFSTELMTSIVEISSTMEEFSATASHIADNSGNVVKIANRSLEETRKGAQAVEAVSMKMKEINQYSDNNIKAVTDLGDKSEEITKIMEFINEIANQTKLIAFNAALEAAGAGESGKRFSVVAVEIRRLAENVVQSTGEIEEKIDEIMETVNEMIIISGKNGKMIREASSYSQQTTSMLGQIVAGAESTTDAARQISLSTQQQQTAGKQVVRTITHIRNGYKEGNEAIHRIHAISKDHQKLKQTVMELLGRFKIDRHPNE